MSTSLTLLIPRTQQTDGTIFGSVTPPVSGVLPGVPSEQLSHDRRDQPSDNHAVASRRSPPRRST